jgi:hypothetical protein
VRSRQESLGTCAAAVAARAVDFSGPVRSARPALVNGAAGAVLAPGGRPFAVMWTVRSLIRQAWITHRWDTRPALGQ